MSDEFYTIAETAARLKISQQTVRGWLKAGRLHSYRFGRSIRIRVDELEQLIADSAGTPTVHRETVLPFMGDAETDELTPVVK